MNLGPKHEFLELVVVDPSRSVLIDVGDDVIHFLLLQIGEKLQKNLFDDVCMDLT